MKVLILNRRDIANPAGGGAEIYTHEIAKGLVTQYGCEVTVFSSAFIGCRADEAIDGVVYRRRGNEATVHLHGFRFALKNRKNFDRIIDEFNGIGFFTFFLPNSVLLIYQLYREFWFRELGAAGALPWIFEPLILRLYRKKRAITISDSTKSDLRRLGFGDIRTVMVAIGESPGCDPLPVERTRAIMFLGRLRSTKRPDHAVEIFRRARQKMPDLQLWLVGRGPEEEKLRRTVKDLAGVTFWGWVDDDMKMSLLRKASVLVVPSIREGFGINVIEAAAAGTPAIGFDVPGIRDSIRHGETGYLVKTPDEAAARVVELCSDGRRYTEISKRCIEYAGEFRWDNRVAEFWRNIGGEVKP